MFNVQGSTFKVADAPADRRRKTDIQTEETETGGGEHNRAGAGTLTYTRATDRNTSGSKTGRTRPSPPHAFCEAAAMRGDAQGKAARGSILKVCDRATTPRWASIRAPRQGKTAPHFAKPFGCNFVDRNINHTRGARSFITERSGVASYCGAMLHRQA